MKIEIQQLSHTKKKAIVYWLRKVGGQGDIANSVYSPLLLDIAREIEHGDLLLVRYNYPQQDKEVQQ